MIRLFLFLLIFEVFNPLKVLSEESYKPYRESEKMNFLELKEFMQKEFEKTPDEILKDPNYSKIMKEYIDYILYLGTLEMPKNPADRTPLDLIKTLPDISYEARVELIPCLIEANKLKGIELIESANKSLEIQSNWFAFDCRGRGQYNLGNNQAAIKDYTLSLNLMPKYYLPMAAETFNAMGLAKYEIEQYEDAIADINSAIVLASILKKPKANYFYNRGLVITIMMLSKDEKDIKLLKKVLMDLSRSIDLNPNVAEAYYLRALIREELEPENKEKICIDVNRTNELGLRHNELSEFCSS